MKIKILVIISLLITISIAAQENDKLIIQESYLTLNLMSPIISYSPRWDIGFMQPINEKWYIGLEAGYGTYNSSINFTKDTDRLSEDYRLWEIRPQLYYILGTPRKTTKYFSTELFFINHTDNLTNSEFVLNANKDNSIYIRYDSADYKRQKVGINILYGMFIDFNEHLGLNLSTGFGIRNRNVKHSNVVNPILSDSDTNSGDASFLTNNYLENEGVHIGVNFMFDLKFYVKL